MTLQHCKQPPQQMQVNTKSAETNTRGSTLLFDHTPGQKWTPVLFVFMHCNFKGFNGFRMTDDVYVYSPYAGELQYVLGDGTKFSIIGSSTI